MAKRWIRESIGLLIRGLGIHFIFIRLISRNKATIIVYHDPKPDRFSEHIRYLSQYYNFIPLNQLVNAIHARNWKDVPANALVVTFDDGFRGNHKLIEILKTYNIRPTVYLCSHIVNTNRRYWWKTGISDLDGLKKLPFDRFCDTLKNEIDFEPEKEFKERQSLNEVELEEMLPFADFGSHTKFHPILTKCPAPKSQDEIRNSKTYLEKILGHPIEHFCYPNGDYGQREIGYVKRSGYRSARTLDWGWNHENSDPFRLKVIEFLDDAPINTLCGQLIGVFTLLRNIRLGLMRIFKL